MAISIDAFDLDEGKGLVSFISSLSLGGATKVKGKKVQQIGTPDTFLKIYSTIKQLQALIDFKAKYIVKDGFFIASRDESAKEKVEEFFNSLNIEEIIEMWAKAAMIYGNGYLEFTKDNLILRDARKMFLYIDEDGHGVPVAYVQELGDDPAKYPVFAPEEIFVLKNNPMDPLRGLSAFMGIEDIVELDDSAMTDLSATLNRQATRKIHYKIGSETNPIPVNSTKFVDAQDLIEEIRPGDDLITNGDVEAKIIDGGSAGSDFKDYLELINARMCMQMGVPSDFYFGQSGGPTIDARKQVFEQAEIIPRRRVIENIINTQLIPQLTGKTQFPVHFRFGDINTEMAFLKKKMELIELQTNALTPDELRIKSGKDPLTPEQLAQAQAQAGQQQQIPVSSKDETAKGTIGGNLTGARPSNG